MRLAAILAILLFGAGSALADCPGHNKTVNASSDQVYTQSSGKQPAQQQSQPAG